jgi:hypothetical protein
MARKTISPALPHDPEAAANYWRQRAGRAEEEVVQLRAVLKQKEAIEAGKPVPMIVRARKPKLRY